MGCVRKILLFVSVLIIAVLQAEAIDNPNFTKEKTFTLQTTKNLQEFAKIFHSISTLKGIQYYSHSNEKWTTLYHGAGFIENAKSRKYLPDTYYTGANKAYFCLLDDNSLGDCVFKVSYTETSNEIRMDLLLVEPIKIWGFTGVYPNNLVIRLKVTKTTSETLQASISINAKYQTVPFLDTHLTESFNARMDSLYKWIVGQL